MSVSPRRCFIITLLLLWSVGLTLPFDASGQTPRGFLNKDGKALYPLGFYELPQAEADLRDMAAAGVNVVRCHSQEDLDRAASVGMLGIHPISLQQGDTADLRAEAASLKDHPALAVWEGPDEIVWNFTAFSGLHRTQGVYPTPDEWWRQTPLAWRYSEEQASRVIPSIHSAVKAIRELDADRHPFWINEANGSDVRLVREYLDSIDITGCDIYPVKKEARPLEQIGFGTDKWRKIGQGKPVWMVLQAFSWNELGSYYGHSDAAYPTFNDSRHMAYSAIVHGASGILYWGSDHGQSTGLRQSLYALVSELASLQPFLTAPSLKGVSVEVIRSKPDEQQGVQTMIKQVGEDWLVMVVNEDNERHMAAVIKGLEALDGKTLQLLYGEETAKIRKGEIVLRLQPYEVKVFATGARWESSRREGRNFAG